MPFVEFVDDQINGRRSFVEKNFALKDNSGGQPVMLGGCGAKL
jgi:hypothetical protein